MSIFPVILAGGAGSRLWPLSRAEYPKPFIPLLGETSLFQETVRRARGLDDVEPPLVVCNESQRFLVAEQLRAAGSEPSVILLEPIARNTAAAIALAALEALQRGADPLLLVLPADHHVPEHKDFAEAVARATPAAAAGNLVTFGIVPLWPETGFGYIRAQAEAGAEGVFPVREFVEKPDAEHASRYLASGEYYWNSGMFLFAASAYLEALGAHAPEVAEACREAHAQARRELDFTRVDADAFARSPDISVDYAVMEPAPNVVMVPFEGAWNDVGSWTALQGLDEADGENNVIVGDVLALENRHCYLRAESRLLATVGLENLLVVETADAVLVAHRDRAQDVRRVVQELAVRGRSEHLNHARVLRPWGSYECISGAERFQVKRIVVKPGQSLSLQMHHHRAEHWVVVRGTAKVTRGTDTLLLTEDQSTYIPLGTVHRLENPGSIPLEIIEVQSGSYLGEDDIVRFEDAYGRGSANA